MLAILFVTSAYAVWGAEVVVKAAMIVDEMVSTACRRDGICNICSFAGGDGCTSLSISLLFSGAAKLTTSCDGWWQIIVLCMALGFEVKKAEHSRDEDKEEMRRRQQKRRRPNGPIGEGILRRCTMQLFIMVSV